MYMNMDMDIDGKFHIHGKPEVFSFDRYIFRMKFPTGFIYRNLHGFSRFPGDSTALASILFYEMCQLKHYTSLCGVNATKMLQHYGIGVWPLATPVVKT